MILRFIFYERKMNQELTTNEKRIESCKKRGSLDKRRGHERETEFNQQFNETKVGKIEYKNTSDSSIQEGHEIIPKLKEKFGREIDKYNVSIKGKKSIQFTLGVIPEISLNDDPMDVTKEEWKIIYEKYLKKVGTSKPSDFLVYKDEEENQWIFFYMDDVIHFLVKEVIWRRLKSGRWKGDIKDNSKKGIRQYLTFEFRKNHKSHFFGINGGKGKKFIELLKEKIKYVEYCYNL